MQGKFARGLTWRAVVARTGQEAKEQRRGRSRVADRPRKSRPGSPCQLLTAESSTPLTFFNAPVGTHHNAALPVIPAEQLNSAQTSPRDVTSTTPPAAPRAGSPAFHTARDYSDKSGRGPRGLSSSDACLTPRLLAVSPEFQTPNPDLCPDLSPGCSSADGETGESPGGWSSQSQEVEDRDPVTREAPDSLMAMTRAVRALALRTAALRRISGLQKTDLRSFPLPDDVESPLGVVSPAPHAPVGEAGILLQDLPIAGVGVYHGRFSPPIPPPSTMFYLPQPSPVPLLPPSLGGWRFLEGAIQNAAGVDST